MEPSAGRTRTSLPRLRVSAWSMRKRSGPKRGASSRTRPSRPAGRTGVPIPAGSRGGSQQGGRRELGGFLERRGRLEHLDLDRPAPGRNRDRHDRAHGDEDRADPDGWAEAVHEARARAVTTVAGEDRCQDGDAEHAAKLTDRVVRARRLSLLARANGSQDYVRDRGEEERHPDPREDERADQIRIRNGRRRDGRDPAEPDRLQREPDAHDPRPRDAIRERACDRRDEDRHRRPGEDAEAGAEGRVTLHGLEELREQEDRAEHAEEHEQRGDVRLRERPVAEEAHRQHRRLRAQLPEDEQGDQHRAGADRAHDLETSPADAVTADEPPDDPEQTRAREPEAGQVELRARPPALVQAAPGERDQQQPDRDVEPEDPLPRHPLDDGAADERAERDREAADAAPCAEREPAPLGASAANAEAAVKIPSPITNRRRRPKRSPSAAPVRSRTAKVSV